MNLGARAGAGVIFFYPFSDCTYVNCYLRTRAASPVFARRAMASSKAEDSWTKPEGVLCRRLYKSGLVKFGINLGWPKNMERTTKQRRRSCARGFCQMRGVRRSRR